MTPVALEEITNERKQKKTFWNPGSCFGCMHCYRCSIFISDAVRRNKVADVVTVEAGTLMPDASMFYNGTAKKITYASDISTIPLDVPGIYDIEINVNGRVYKSRVEVKDTTPPRE